MIITKENSSQFLGQEVIMTDGKEAYKGKLLELSMGQWPNTQTRTCIRIPLRFPYTLGDVMSLGYSVVTLST